MNRPPTPGMHPKCWSWRTATRGWWQLLASTRKACCRRRLRRGRPGSYGLGVRRGLGRRDARSGPVLRGPQGGSCGECGLDYHWPVPKDAQLAMFEAHIRLALELDKPIIVHDRNAHADVYALLKKYQPRASSTAIPAVPTMRCGWQSRDCSSVLAGRVPSRVPSGRQKPSAPCRWKASCWRPTAPTWHRSRCAAPAVTAPSSAMWRVYRPAAGHLCRRGVPHHSRKCPPGIRAVIRFSQVAQFFSLCFCINQQSKSKLL